MSLRQHNMGLAGSKCWSSEILHGALIVIDELRDPLTNLDDDLADCHPSLPITSSKGMHSACELSWNEPPTPQTLQDTTAIILSGMKEVSGNDEMLTAITLCNPERESTEKTDPQMPVLIDYIYMEPPEPSLEL